MDAVRFSSGGRGVAVERAAVRGTHLAPRITPVPGSPAWLLGVCPAEGRAVAVIDVIALAGAPASWNGAPAAVVLVASPVGLLALPADGPHQVGGTFVNPGARWSWEADGVLHLDLEALPGAIVAALASAFRG